MLAAILLGESYGLIEAGSTLLALGGTVLVSRPPFIFGDGSGGGNVAPAPSNVSAAALAPATTTSTMHGPPLVGTALALASALSASCAFIAIRTLKETHFATVIFAQAFMQVLGAPAGFVATGQSLDALHWEQALLLGQFWSFRCLPVSHPLRSSSPPSLPPQSALPSSVASRRAL